MIINSLALLGTGKSRLTKDQEVDEDKYDMRKPKEAVEILNQRRIKAFGHILVSSKAYAVIGPEVFEVADPCTVLGKLHQRL